MARKPRTKKDWAEAGFEVAVIVKQGTTPVDDGSDVKSRHSYGTFHKMEASDWDFRSISHIIPIATFDDAMESFAEFHGAGPCQKCFPGAKMNKVEDDDDPNQTE